MPSSRLLMQTTPTALKNWSRLTKHCPFRRILKPRAGVGTCGSSLKRPLKGKLLKTLALRLPSDFSLKRRFSPSKPKAKDPDHAYGCLLASTKRRVSDIRLLGLAIGESSLKL